MILRIREPRTTALVFASGKVVVTGAKSESDAKLSCRKFSRSLQKLGFKTKLDDFKVQNIVGSCDVRFSIRLEGLAHGHFLSTSYEPELFPGLVYRMVRPKLVVLVFVSGKIVITGAKSLHDLDEGFRLVYPILKGLRHAPCFPINEANSLKTIKRCRI